MSVLQVNHLSSGYGNKIIVNDVSFTLPNEKITIFLGANGCGKSTLLKTMARIIPPSNGQILLDNTNIHSLPTKTLAKHLGLLPQSPVAMDGIQVYDLILQGRYPHLKPFSSYTQKDYEIVEEAMKDMRIIDLAKRPIHALSGGQRQRVWIALALAQQTDILLLDEPTTYLDIAYQVEILDLLKKINQTRKITIAMVLHDINLSSRYADHMIAMKEGKIFTSGKPNEVIQKEVLREVYGLESEIIEDPVYKTPMIIPLGSR